MTNSRLLCWFSLPTFGRVLKYLSYYWTLWLWRTSYLQVCSHPRLPDLILPGSPVCHSLQSALFYSFHWAHRSKINRTEKAIALRYAKDKLNELNMNIWNELYVYVHVIPVHLSARHRLQTFSCIFNLSTLPKNIARAHLAIIKLHHFHCFAPFNNIKYLGFINKYFFFFISDDFLCGFHF